MLQHSLKHYGDLIWAFGAPNGLCSSITESRHITAVKRPWRRSNRNDALGQVLVTNQRLDNLAASRVDFVSRGMLTLDPGASCMSFSAQYLIVSSICIANKQKGDVPEPDFDMNEAYYDLPDLEIDAVEDGVAPNQFDIVSGPRMKECVVMAKTVRKYLRTIWLRNDLTYMAQNGDIHVMSTP